MGILFSRARGRMLLSAITVAAIAPRFTSFAVAGQNDYDKVLCYEQFQSAHPGVALPNENPLGLERAMNLFRFHHRTEALARIDGAVKTAAGPWRYRIPSDRRKEVRDALLAFRRCVATSRMPAMATLTVQVTHYQSDPSDPSTGQGRETMAAGARVLVERVPVGVTAGHGSVTVQVPPGQIHVTAEIPRTQWGEAYVDLAPGEMGAVTIGLHDGKEVTERTELALVEAADDIIPFASPTFTLRFARDGAVVPMARIEDIQLEFADGHTVYGDELFEVVDGAIAARHPQAVFAALGDRLEETVTASVSATDTAGLAHGGRVAFRVGQSGLFVTLAAPPSNPALRLADVEVGVSLMGAGIAVHRVSDASGRFAIDAFPHGTIAFDAEVQQDGRYYYGQATMAHFGPRSVTLVLRHVSDVLNGVPELEPGPASAERAPATRRQRRRPGP